MRISNSRRENGVQMSRVSTWSEYVHDVTHGAPQREIAARTTLNQGTISRWLNDRHEQPGAAAVVILARAYGANVIEALVASGYITPEEAKLKARSRINLADVPTSRLIRELDRRTKTAAGDAA